MGLGVKCSKEVATAIRGAIILAKLSIVPVRRGYWGNKIGKPHTVPCKVTGRCGSVLVRLIPAPRGTGIVSAPVPKKLLMMAGIDDCYTSARGCTATLGNFGRTRALCLPLNFSPSSAQLHLHSGVVVVIRRDINEYCNARQIDFADGLFCSPFSTLQFLLVAYVRHLKLKHLILISAKATFDAISKTYSYLTPDLWKETVFTKSPYQVRFNHHFISWLVIWDFCSINIFTFFNFRSSLTIWPRLTPGCQCRGDRLSQQHPPKCWMKRTFE